MISKNGQETWMKQPVESNVGRIQNHNVLRERSGPTARAMTTCRNSPKDAFISLITTEIQQQIVNFINIEGNRKRNGWIATTSDELYCFYGLLILAGAYHENKTRISELWSSLLLTVGPSSTGL